MELPDFNCERELGQDFLVIGVDEVGRGALAGPVVAGAVAIVANDEWLELGINDSKKLSAKKREKLAKIIKKDALWGIGEVPVSYINRYGIVKATEKAMRLAIRNLKLKIENGKSIFLLIDAFSVPYVPKCGIKNQKAIIKGDQKSISIAAASIIAKVYRDELMGELSKKHTIYRWKENKGYGTKAHCQAIKKFGSTKLHRLQFISGLV